MADWGFIPMHNIDFPPNPEMAKQWKNAIAALSPLLHIASVPAPPPPNAETLGCSSCDKDELFNSRDCGVQPLADLMAAAEGGCDACLIRLHGALKAARWLQSYGYGIHGIEVYCRGPVVKIRSRESGATSTVLLYTNDREARLPWHVVGMHRELGTRRSTYPSILSEWLRDCANKHPWCAMGPGSSEAPLPLRVLDVGEVGADSVRLRISQGLHDRGKFAALSHCWGGVIASKTTRDNYEAHQRGISMLELPKTFQDAVEVTRAVGIRFLWIDALCILQDDKEDWEVESSRMAAIYRDAWVVFSADISTSMTSGFLHSEKIDGIIESQQYRHGRLGPGIEIAKVQSEGTMRSVFAREHVMHRDYATLFEEGELGGPRSITQPLHRRGWTLQEQMLATRMIHFTDLELVWECKSHLRCECKELDCRLGDEGVNGRPTWHCGISGAPFTRNTRAHMELALTAASKNNDRAAMYSLWRATVEEALRRDLTYESDLLPALAGIADLFQRAGTGTYLAGHWLENMPAELLWGFDTRFFPERTTSYRAPSWSWASVRTLFDGEGEVFWGRIGWSPNSQVKTFCHVLGAGCTPRGVNPLGEISGGCLTLRAPLLEARFDPPESEGFWGELVPIVRPWRLKCVRLKFPILYYRLDNWKGNPSSDLAVGDQWMSDGGTVHLLFVRGDAKYTRSNAMDGSEGLILRHRADVSDKTFERVGYFVTMLTGSSDTFCSPRKRLSLFLGRIRTKDWVHFAKLRTVDLI
jgi:hypothetical protein